VRQKDFGSCLLRIARSPANGRPIMSSLASDAAATLARCCGRGRPHSWSATAARWKIRAYSCQPAPKTFEAGSRRLSEFAVEYLVPFSSDS
jgi:hypothetical protein